MILAFGHESRVGKDTAAAAVALARADLGVPVRRASFAHALKRAAHGVWGYAGLKGADYYETVAGALERNRPLPGVGKTPVELWVELGQAVRATHPETWVDQALSRERPGELLVVSDLRFPNEAEAIRRRGGWVVKIERPGDRPLYGSDREIPAGFNWDAVLVNAGTVEQLQREAVTLARDYLVSCGRGVPIRPPTLWR